MCAYVFLSESELPPPRAIRRVAAEAAAETVQETPSGVAQVMECVVEALMAFPDAYRAVLRLLQERCPRVEAKLSP
jgi:hypothetical protein